MFRIWSEHFCLFLATSFYPSDIQNPCSSYPCSFHEYDAPFLSLCLCLYSFIYLLRWVFWTALCSTNVISILLYLSSTMKIPISYSSWYSTQYVCIVYKFYWSLSNLHIWPHTPSSFNISWLKVLNLKLFALPEILPGHWGTFQTQQWRAPVPRLFLEALLGVPGIKFAMLLNILSFTWPCWGTSRISGPHLGSLYDPLYVPAGYSRPHSAPLAASASHQWHLGGTHSVVLLSLRI